MAAEADTITDQWQSLASSSPDREAIVFLRADGTEHRWTWGHLYARARHYAAASEASQIKRGDVCALMFRHHPELYPLYMGLMLRGAIPAILSHPNPRLHQDKFRDGLSGMARKSGLVHLLTEREFAQTVTPVVESHETTLSSLHFPLEWPSCEPSPITPADSEAPCLLQHSSGTTGLQKAVMLSHATVADHVERYAAALQLTERDRVVSWLPLYHDMGLIAAFHLPLALGIPSVQLDPFEWVLAPELLLQAMHRERGTVVFQPNFAFSHLALRAHDDELEGVRLDHVRVFVNCSEPVRAQTHARFEARFAKYGVRPEMLSACYAMAETTFAATQTRPGTRATELSVDREALAQGRVIPSDDETATTLVSSGMPIADCTVRVIDDEGNPLDEGHIGELVVRSRSLALGYRNDSERTAQRFKEGAYYTGDSGFIWNNECYVLGRKSDLLIVAGKNLFPEDIEAVVSEVAGVLPGRVVAFGIDDEALGTQQVAIIAETEVAKEAHIALELAIKQAALAIDVAIRQVFLAPPRWLIKSSAGKPSRSANRQRIGELK